MRIRETIQVLCVAGGSIAAVASATAPKPEPARQEPVRAHDWWIERGRDAGVEIVAVEPDALTAGAAVPVTDAAVGPEPDPDEPTYEDGVVVMKMDQRVWCAGDSKKLPHSCWPTSATCKQSTSAPCKRNDSWACFSYTKRTSGKDTIFCASTYGNCQVYWQIASADSELSGVGDCAIVRYEKKR